MSDSSSLNAWVWATDSTSQIASGGDLTAWPRITVVTPSYNQGQFIEETIRSVLLQGYPNLEYIVMDGGSTDQTVEVIEKYASQIDYWESGQDRGQSHAINKGFQRATGDIVAWLNSDDTYLPNALFTIAKAFLANPDVAFIYGVCQLTDEAGEWERDKGAAWDFGRLLRRTYFGQPATFIRRNIVEQIDYVDETLHQVMDWDLWIRMGLVSEGLFIEEPLATARMWDGIKTVHSSRLLKDEHIPVLEKLVTREEIGRDRLKLAQTALAERKFYYGYRAWRLKKPRVAFKSWREALMLDTKFVLWDGFYSLLINRLPRRPVETGLALKRKLVRSS